MFKRFAKIVAAAALALGLAACGQQVEVPSATVGKVMTSKGFSPKTVPTSKFRLSACLPWEPCEEIVLLPISDTAVSENMKLFMPKDKLNMEFVLQATLSLKPESYDEMYTRVAPVVDGGMRYIPKSAIYKIYAQQIILSEAREFLSKYTIADIAANLEAVNAELSSRLAESINKRTPFSVRFIGLSNLQYPPIIVEAQENAAKRTEMIRQEEAQLELSKVAQNRVLQEQRMQRQIDVEKAEADATVAKIQADAMTPKYMQYRTLDVLEKIAASPNKVIVPVGMLDSISTHLQVAR